MIYIYNFKSYRFYSRIDIKSFQFCDTLQNQNFMYHTRKKLKKNIK